LQAAIAAVHAEAPCGEDTDWPQILGLYELLGGLAPGRWSLNRIVAVAMVHGAAESLRLLAAAEADDALTGHHRMNAVRAHLLEMVGDREAARDAYLLAARRTLSFPEQRYLEARAAALRPSPISG
jgi:predicted RNA polymerase sigma factor